MRKAEAAAAAKQIADPLGEDLLLVFTNTSRSQLHFIHPRFEHAQPTLRRMVVERDLPRRTAVQQVANIYWEWRESGDIRAALESAFDVAPVTKRFFAEYKRIFNAAERQVTGFGEDEVEKNRLFVQTLFNRLMFVYFLSRKGWLTFGGDKDYLNALWRDYQAGEGAEKNFNFDRLRLLFFGGLNNEWSEDLTSEPEGRKLIGNVPFLNGGLFDMDERDGDPSIFVPDPCISEILTKLFDRFNFTVMESTPFDIEVAVDPEMLGKVFEELVTGRQGSGAYYTPRPVVSFMCREALKGYLEGLETGLSSEAVAAFVDERDTAGLSPVAAPALSRALDEITVVDPACGSGAYLLGMLQELVELQTALFDVGVDARGLYSLKLHIIERNLYGVDIDKFAVNIAMLRLWLSLAIEGDEPTALPNLDFKIVCGDSLLGPDPGHLDQSRYQIQVSDLPGLKARYMRATANKDDLRREIEDAERQLRTDLGVTAVPEGIIDWRLEFAEVVAARGGFDIAIANPPYVRMEKLNKSDEDSYRANFPAVAASRADLMVFFYARAVELLVSGGSLVFITSNSFTKRRYGAKLRRHLAELLTIDTIIDFGEIKIFNATVEVIVLAARKTIAGPDTTVNGHNLYPLLARRLGRGGSVEQAREAMRRLPEDLETEADSFPQARLDDSEWRIEDESINVLFERLMNQGTPLGESVDGRVYTGVKTGLNEAFVIDRARRDVLIAADPNGAEIIKPWLRGRDIKRWTPDWAERYIIFTNRGVEIDRYPAIREHLEWFRPQLEKRATAHLHPWYELQQPQEGFFAEFNLPKIVWQDIARNVSFALDTNAHYLDMTCFMVPTGSYWLLALLNSKLSEFLLCQITSTPPGGFLRPKRQYTVRLPIVTPTPSLQNRLEPIAQAAVAGEAVDSDELNALVYDLYGLSANDVSLINDWFQRRSLVN